MVLNLFLLISSDWSQKCSRGDGVMFNRVRMGLQLRDMLEVATNRPVPEHSQCFSSFDFTFYKVIIDELR